MKEKYFKVTKSIADSVQAMDDRTAGKFIKSVCDYAFEGKPYDGKDTVIKSNFILVKRVLDGQAQDIAYGKLGAKKRMEIRKNENESSGMCVGRVVVGGGDTHRFLKDLLSTLGSNDIDGEGNK